MDFDCDQLDFSERGWSSTPYACRKNTNTYVVVVGACRAFHFTKSTSSNTFTQVPNTGLQILTFDSSTCEFVLSNTCDGSVYRFRNHTGTLKSYIRGRRTVNYPDSPEDESLRMASLLTLDLFTTEITQAFEQDGRTITDVITNKYISTGENTGRLESSTLSRRINPSSDLRRIVYTYYGSDDPNGTLGDLRTATVQLLRGTTWFDHETEYFRYYKSGDANGFAHALKFVIKPQSFARLTEDPEGRDPFSADDSTVARFADFFYEYDSNERVARAVASAGKFTYTYNFTESSHSNNVANWKMKSVTTRPDGSRETLYSNYLTSPLLRILTSGNDQWMTAYQYDSGARQTLEASPSAVVSYNEASANLSIVLRMDAGVIRTTQYATSTTATATSAGDVAGRAVTTKVQRGTSPSAGGGPFLESETKYFVRETEDGIIYPVAQESTFRNETNNTSDSGKLTTSYQYEWYPDSIQYRERTTTFPAVTTTQNGPGSSTTRTEVFDVYGNLTWLLDQRGFITYHAYDIVTSAVTQTIQDVDTALMTGVPVGWTTPAGGGLHLITDFESDAFGRTTQTLGPWHDVNGQSVRTAEWTVYRDLEHETRTARGYAYGPAPWYEYELANPVSISRSRSDGSAADSIAAVRSVTSGRLSAADVFPQSSWVRWTRTLTNVHGEQAGSRTYHCIPECGYGALDVNYSQTSYGYDVMGRQNRVVAPSGTITRTIFDARGLTLSVWTGTNDAGASDGKPYGTGLPWPSANSSNNMLLVSESVYDGGQAGGDGNLTKSTLWVDEYASNSRITTYVYDWRNRQKAVDGELDFYQENSYDNLGNVTQVDLKNGTSTAGLLARTMTYFDNLGRVYRTERYAVNPTNGALGNFLAANTWYDASGNTVKQVAMGAKDGRAFTKNAYDGVGRRIGTYSGIFTGSFPQSYDLAIKVTGADKIFAQLITAYDNASNTIQAADFRRFDTATGNGALHAFSTGTQPIARTSYVAQWYDGGGRQIASADYGTNDNVELERPASPPERSDDVLVTTLDYDGAGTVYRIVDPAGRESRQAFDAAGRVVLSVSNFVADIASTNELACTVDVDRPCPSQDHRDTGWQACFTPGNDQNVTVRRQYDAAGRLISLIAVNPSTGDQVTRYEYGVVGSVDLLANQPFVYIFDDTYNFVAPIPSGIIATDHNAGGPTLVFSKFNKYGVDVSAQILAIRNCSRVFVTDGVRVWPPGNLVACGTGAVLEPKYYSLHTNSSPDSLPQLVPTFTTGQTLAVIITPP